MNKRPKFICINGRYVRDTSGKEVKLGANAKGNSSLTRMPKRMTHIGFHRWA